MYATAYRACWGQMYAVAYTRISWYIEYMANNKGETATATVRIYPSTRRRINIKAAKEGKTLAKVIDEMSS